MATALTLRADKGAPLTHAEMDANLTALRATADAVTARFGLRNKIINGGGVVAQRGNVVFTSPNSLYGGCDRVLSTISATTVSAIALQAAEPVAGFSSTGYCHQFGNVQTTGTTLIQWSHRIEAIETRSLNGKTVTFSGKIYHTSGVNVTFVPSIEKPNAADNFSAKATIFTGAGFNVPSGVVTPFTYTVTLGATDAANGLQLNLAAAGQPAQANKQWYFADMQFEVGAVATPFDVRHAALETLLCQRYYETQRMLWSVGTTTTYAGATMPFAAKKRTTPTTTFKDFNGNLSRIVGTGTNNIALTGGGISAGVDRIIFDAVTGVGLGNWWGCDWFADAEL